MCLFEQKAGSQIMESNTASDKFEFSATDGCYVALDDSWRVRIYREYVTYESRKSKYSFMIELYPLAQGVGVAFIPDSSELISGEPVANIARIISTIIIVLKEAFGSDVKIEKRQFN